MTYIFNNLNAFLQNKLSYRVELMEQKSIAKYEDCSKAKLVLEQQVKEKGEIAIWNFIFPESSISEGDLIALKNIQKPERINDIIKLLSDRSSILSSHRKNSFQLGDVFEQWMEEWFDSKVLSLASLEIDIGMSKNTLRKIWLPFFYGKNHQYKEVRKISPKDYTLIWKDFVKPPIDNLPIEKLNALEALNQDFVIKKRDLKEKFSVRPKDLKNAIEDAYDQPDYPVKWAKKIPLNTDVFPYSVALLLARELDLT